MVAPSKATTQSAPLNVNESSPIKRLKVALSDALKLDAPAPPLPLLSTPPPSITPSPMPVLDLSHHLDHSTTTSSGSVPATSARDLLAGTHAHWLVSDQPITSADCFDIFDTPPDTALHPSSIPSNSTNASAKPDLAALSPDELWAYTKSLLNHSHNLVDVLKAQQIQIQIRLDGMVISQLQGQIYQKEQHTNRQGSLTTLTTIATDPVFIDVVKEIENATKMKKAKQEANQAARAMKKALCDNIALFSPFPPYSGDLHSLRSLRYPSANPALAPAPLPIPLLPFLLPMTCVSYYRLFLMLPGCALYFLMFVSFSACY